MPAQRRASRDSESNLRWVETICQQSFGKHFQQKSSKNNCRNAAERGCYDSPHGCALDRSCTAADKRCYPFRDVVRAVGEREKKDYKKKNRFNHTRTELH